MATRDERLIVFVKAPEPGRVKTRLCPPLSPESAASLYRAFVRDCLAACAGVAPLEVAYAPSRALPDLGWLGGRAPASFPQRGRGLGSRLQDAFARAFRAGARRVVVIGSDCPTLTPTALRRAFAELKRADLVLGPAADGGYYLIGLSRNCPSLLRGIAWSTPRVYAQTLARARDAGLSWRRLGPLRDVDDAEDLAALRKSLARGRGGPPRWTRLALAIDLRYTQGVR